MENEKQELIAQFHKNSVEVIKVHLQTWKTQRYMDIRIWRPANSAESDSVQPTKKGITLKIELLPELIEALEKAEKFLKVKKKQP